jgi:L-alanine-DL-glutamate epimerase-like enolase superfamily enzyme
MKISIQKHLLNFIKPSGTSRGVLYDKPSWILSIESKNGIKGTGEFSVIPGLSPDFMDEENYELEINRLIDFLNELFLSSFTIEQQIEKVKSQFFQFPSLIFGIETALLDYYNGGKGIIFKNKFSLGQTSIPINGLIWMESKENMKAQIEEKLKLGFKTIKLKIGAISIHDELALIEHIRNEYSADDITIRVDANGAFNPIEARSILIELKKLNVHSIEQPIAAGNWEEMKLLCSEHIIPIALDEELIGIYSKESKNQLLNDIKPQFIILKPSLHGGFSGCSEWITLAEERKIGWWITSALESSIGLNAIAQFTANYPITLPQGLGTGGLYTNNLPSNLLIEQGYLKLKQDAIKS